MNTCTRCASPFSVSEALCEDWKDPEKSFGCPRCGTFFIRNMTPTSWQSLVVSLVASLVGILVGVGIATPAITMLAAGVRADDPLVIVMSSIILASVVAIAAIAIAFTIHGSVSALKVSPYRREIGESEVARK
jgi:ABC-type uncharacterized transport system permease subunit